MEFERKYECLSVIFILNDPSTCNDTISEGTLNGSRDSSLTRW